MLICVCSCLLYFCPLLLFPLIFSIFFTHLICNSSFLFCRSSPSLSFTRKIGDWTSEELKVLTANANKIRFKGQIVSIDSLSIHSLLPNLDRFMTYDGSMTSPGCFETVTWIILNKPLNISRQDVSLLILSLMLLLNFTTSPVANVIFISPSPRKIYSLRKIMQGDSETPKAPLGNNFRPIQPLNQRYIRTNIDFTRKQVSRVVSLCVSLDHFGPLPLSRSCICYFWSLNMQINLFLVNPAFCLHVCVCVCVCLVCNLQQAKKQLSEQIAE